MTVLNRKWKNIVVAAVVTAAITGVPITAAAASTTPASGTKSPGCETRTPLPPSDRGFTYHVPDDLTSDPLPLILAFHGAKSYPAEIQDYSGLDAAEAVVVYPEGPLYRDDDGEMVHGWSPDTHLPHPEPDLDFTAQLVTDFEHSFCIDTSRVYATGKSEGGGFTYELACPAQGKRLVDAIAPVAGAFYRPGKAGVPASGCDDAPPLPVLEIHGKSDHIIDYTGTTRSQPIFTDFDAHDVGWVNGWVDRDGCDRHQLPSSYIAGNVHYRAWGGCSAGGSVEHYELLDGDHTWPGALDDSGPGTTDRELCATKTILDFFGVAISSTVPISQVCTVDSGVAAT